MTYLQILNLIKDTALAQPNVNSVVREFLDLNREDAKYSAVVIQDRDGNRDRIVEQDYVTYTWHLGYVDRLTYDESNRDDIISTGINIINNIVNTIRNTWFPELEVSIVDRINTFDQRFTAQCAGVYVVLAVNAQVSDCIDSESTDLYDTYDAKITANGVYHFVPSGRPVDEINITVDVAGSGKEEVSLTDTVTMNGIHTYIPEEDTVYKDVELTVDVHPTERLVETYTTNGTKTITGEFNGGEITVDVDTDTVWGSITGNITNQTDLVDYVTGKDNEIKTWVSEQGYLTEHQSLDGYATETWVESKGYALQSEIPDMSGYALKSEIPSLDGYVQETNLITINDQPLIGEYNLSIQMPLVISIDLDSGEYMGNYDDYMSLFANVYYNEGDDRKVIVYLNSANLGIEYNSFPSDIKTIVEEDRIIVEVGGCFLDDRDENNKKLVYYRIKGNDITKKVEVSFTPVPSDADIPDLTGYATQEWVENQLSNYTTNSDFTSLQNRVVTLETNYGDALNITNQILG